MNVHRFIQKYLLAQESEPAPENPHMDIQWPDELGSHWFCSWSIPGKTGKARFYFSLGSAHRAWTYDGARDAKVNYGVSEAKAHQRIENSGGLFRKFPHKIAEWTKPVPPTVADCVLNLAMTCQMLDIAPTFEEWAYEWGLDEDSRSAERTYQQCKALSRDIRALFGPTMYAEFLEVTEDADTIPYDYTIVDAPVDPDVGTFIAIDHCDIYGDAQRRVMDIYGTDSVAVELAEHVVAYLNKEDGQFYDDGPR